MYRTGVAKISNIVLGMPDIPDIWGVGQIADAGSNPTYEKNECTTPYPLSLGLGSLT